MLKKEAIPIKDVKASRTKNLTQLSDEYKLYRDIVLRSTDGVYAIEK